jgi:hypothetical protein
MAEFKLDDYTRQLLRKELEKRTYQERPMPTISVYQFEPLPWGWPEKRQIDDIVTTKVHHFDIQKYSHGVFEGWTYSVEVNGERIDGPKQPWPNDLVEEWISYDTTILRRELQKRGYNYAWTTCGPWVVAMHKRKLTMEEAIEQIMLFGSVG